MTIATTIMTQTVEGMVSLTKSQRITRLVLIGAVALLAVVILWRCNQPLTYTSNPVVDGKPLVFVARNSAYTALSTIAFALFSTAVVELAMLGIDSLERRRELTKFRRFYSIEGDGRVVIVLPKFVLNNASATPLTRQRELARLTAGVKNDPAFTLRDCTAFGDIKSAAAIAESFSENLVSAPELVADSDPIVADLIKALQKQKQSAAGASGKPHTTFVAIGLNSNDLSAAVLLSLFSKDLEVWYSSQETQLRPIAMDGVRYSYEYDPPSEWDFAIVARARCREATILIVAGITEESTVQAGAYLRHNWSKFATAHANDEMPIQTRDFFRILQVARGSGGGGAVQVAFTSART